MKILVTYYSQTGQTKKIAKVIHEAVAEKHESTLKKLSKVSVDNLNDYDLVFAGAPCHHSDLAAKLKKFLSSIPPNPSFKLAGFFTHACLPPENSEEDKLLFERWVGKCAPTFEQVVQEKNISFLGYFRCMGAASKMIEIFIRREIITDKNKWEEYLPDLRASPKAEDLANARAFALNVLQQIE